MFTDKQSIRAAMATPDRMLPDETARLFSERICHRLVTVEAFLQARCVALYCAVSNEVQTAGFIEEWYGRKQLVLPVVSKSEMTFYQYAGKERLLVGAFGIPSPDPACSAPVSGADIDLFIIPGIAFDRERNRLGHGKGFYDRYLSKPDCSGKPLVGLCFDCQLLNGKIPVERHDKQMTMIITENEII